MNRRDFLAASALGVVSCSRQEQGGLVPSVGSNAVPNLREERQVPECPRTAHQTAGPFYIEEPIMRSAIHEGQPGRRLRVRFSFVRAGDCRPVVGVLASLFHSNAVGLYSGFSEQGIEGDRDTRGQSWCRGRQISDAQGQVSFETIYPGWYTGRVTHMHLTATYEGELRLATQVYFPDALLRETYSRPPYSGWRDTEEEDDQVIAKVTRGVLPRLLIDPGTPDFGTSSIALKL